MSEDPRPSGYGTPPEVLPPNPGRATIRRAPGGVLVPWLATLVVLLLLALAFTTLVNRGPQDEVPRALLESRASVAHATAQAMRKGLDEASDDLAVLAAVLAERPEEQWDRLMDDFLEVHQRYQNVYLVGEDRQPQRLRGSARPRAELLPDPLPAAPGLIEPQSADNLPALLAFAPVPGSDPALLLVGRYDVTFFVPALEQLAPGTAYLVNAEQEVVGSTAGFLSFQQLPTPALVDGATRATDTGTPSGALVADEELVAFSAVRGQSPAGRLGLTVLSVVERQELALPRNDARRLALLLGVLTGLLSVLSLFWMYLFVIGPVRRVARQAERIAFGDRSEPLHVVRYDEIGLITRALERCRVLLQSSTAKGR